MSTLSGAGIALTCVALLPLLFGELRDDRRIIAVAKPLASVGFLLAALGFGALDHPYGLALFTGLVLSLLGDVLLIPRSRRTFLFGLVAFLLGHVAYVVAFVGLAPPARPGLLALLALAPGLGVVLRWLLPSVSGRMRGPVVVYAVVITAMLAASVSARAVVGWLAPAGALLFYVSDLCVARDRFVSRGPENRLIGLPLYYAGQLLLAASAAAGA